MNLRVFVPLLLTLTAASAGVSARPLTMEDAEARALSANPQLRAAKLDVVASGARRSEAIGHHFGKVDLVGIYNTFDNARLVRPIGGPLNPTAMGAMPFDRNQFHFGVTWQIPLLASGRLLYGDEIAKDMETMAKDSLAHGRAELRYKVRAAYRNLLVLSHAIEAVKAYEEALAADKHAADLKVKVEAWPAVAAQKVTFALEGAWAQKARLLGQRQAAEAILAALMGEDPPLDGFAVEDITAEPDVQTTPALQGLLDHARTGRRDLQAARAAARAAQHRRDMARAAFLPEVAVQGNYLRHAAPSVSGTLVSFDFGLVLKIPLLWGATRWYAMDERAAELDQAREKTRTRELKVAAQVAAAAGRLDAARAQVRSGIARRDLGREVVRVEHLKLMQGTGRMEDYLAARAAEVEGEASYWQALYGLQTARDYLDFAAAMGGQS